MINRFFSFILFLCCLFLIVAGASAKGIERHPGLIEGELNNGLTYYIFPNDYPKGEAVYRLFIKSGSIYEKESQKGLAHFLEHMAFNGSKHFPGNSLVRFLESKGARFGKDLNAHTSFNETVYKLQLPSNDPSVVDSTITILADWCGGLLLDSLEIENERGVILSEWLSKTGPKFDAQNALLMELLNNSHFSQRIVIGDTAVIKNFPHQELRDFYNEWYHPSLMAVAVTGDIDAVAVERAIVEKFGGYHGKKRRLPDYAIPDYREMELKSVIDDSFDKIELVGLQLMPLLSPVKKERDYPAYLQRILLNRLFSLRLNTFSFDHPDYNKASAGLSSFLNEKSVLTTSVELQPNKVVSGAGQFLDHLEQMYRYGFISAEIERVKKSYLASLERKAYSKAPVQSINLMNEIYSDFFTGNTIVTPKEEFRLAQKYIEKIDSTSLVHYMQKTMDWDKTHFLLTSFETEGDETLLRDSIFTILSNIKRKKLYPYAKEIEIRSELLNEIPSGGKIVSKRHIPEVDIDELILSNGARVFYKHSSEEKERILLSGFRKGGLYAVDSTNYVSGSYAAGIIGLSGAGNFSRDELSYFLAGNTASVRFLIDKTRSGISASSVPADMETLFQLLYLRWTQPRVDNSVFNQIKEKAIESYQNKNETGSEKFYEAFSTLLQEDNYTNRKLNDTIIDRELHADKALKVFNDTFGGAGSFTFVIISDLLLEELEPYIETYLAGLPEGTPDMDYKIKRNLKPIQERIVFEQHIGENPRASVSLLFQQDTAGESAALNSLEDDLIKAVIRMKLLRALREEMGMVYSVSVSASSTLYPSPVSRQTISFTTAEENVEILIERTLSELKKMAYEPDYFLSELMDVKTNLKKEMELNKQKSTFWSSTIRNTIFNNEREWRIVTDFNEIIQGITSAQIAGKIAERMVESDSFVQAVLYPGTNRQ